ncbi:hypothetical protein CWI42_081420 [Ordospora colligata]|uniref:Uncharacterized protein n=1 Tax=Ordospora colligata OC4 TaxID=1354746 RepID=A0A0B2UE96_9MICR|nr:uncharacterized protein M896_081420 [Ordospora colligata OC4]KHN69406.1 hypothetical protein M896_081420 [Ordospora colligata OC4]TBU14920.1 hypothetical protein CWI41_081410 [Ordospora colligata]TBU15051.1 hypothetical protein CWI40_081430 [Ordospora colligata]TBU18305.1 hypothetical protein CWI42_081420 [Ordospora colligata]
MKLLVYAGCAIGALFYGIERIRDGMEGVKPYAKEIVQGWNTTVYLMNTEREIRNIPFPLLIQQLSNLDEFVIERGGSVYVIKPFKSIRIDSSDGRLIFGIFYGIESVTNDEVIVKYLMQKWEGNVEMYSSIKVMFTPYSGDNRVERVYSGRSELCILRVLTPKLNLKQEIRMMQISALNVNEEGNEKYWMDCLGYESMDGSNKEIVEQEIKVFEKFDNTGLNEKDIKHKDDE